MPVTRLLRLNKPVVMLHLHRKMLVPMLRPHHKAPEPMRHRPHPEAAFAPPLRLANPIPLRRHRECRLGATGGPPPPPGGAPRTGTPTAPPAKARPKVPKYPPGDREHIPESDRVIFGGLSEHLVRLKQNTQPQQQRMVDDIERWLNVLFDAISCETLSRPVFEQL